LPDGHCGYRALGNGTSELRLADLDPCDPRVIRDLPKSDPVRIAASEDARGLDPQNEKRMLVEKL
jgi:hypothetical protein